MSSLPPVESTEQAKTIANDSLAPEQNAPNPFARDILFVATNLDSWEAGDIRYGYEVMLDVCYRRLDATYYAWLRDKMTHVKQTHNSGKMKSELFQELRQRFNAIHEWAVRHIGEETLLQGIGTTNVKSYVPPSETTFAAYRNTLDDAWDAYQQRPSVRSQSPAAADQASRLAHLISSQGYAGIRSMIIDDIVLIVRDGSAAVPSKWSGKVRFTLDELGLMIGSTPEIVKQIHEVKRILGGEVVPADGYPFPDDRATAAQTGHVQQSLFQTATA